MAQSLSRNYPGWGGGAGWADDLVARKRERPGVLGIWGEWLFILRELGSTGNYFQGFEEQTYSFGNIGSPAKTKKKSHLKEKAFITLAF